MKKKNLFLGVLLASAAFGLAACQGAGDSTTSGTTPTTTQGVTPTTTETTTQQGDTKYSVKFMDGTTEVSSVEVAQGGKVTKPATNPTKAEDDNNTYEFVTWCKDSALTTEFNFEKETISAATTIYAKFAAVSKDTAIKMNGTEYATLADAFAAIPTTSTDTFVITLPKGNYTAEGLSYNGSATIKIKGNTTTKYGADVVITGHGSDMSQEKTRNLIEIQGTGNIILENITLVSDWTRDGAGTKDVQSEVLGTDTTGNTIAYNCGFKSHQDTLRTVGKAWFYGCYIEGDVDFIWMEKAGIVALYEKCEIVSVYDSSTFASHDTIVAAPRMSISSKVGKGLVIYNSTVKESDEAKAKGQKTYLARCLNSSGCYDQVAYINTTCNDIETSVFKNSQFETEYPKTVIGWKMDKATAASLNYEGNDNILDDDTVAKEFGGRKAILNRIYNTGKLKYEKDEVNLWDIDAVINENNFLVDADTSSNTLDGEVVGETAIYKFDGTEDQSALCSGFAKEDGKAHYRGGNGATITIPVSGKCYVEVYGYYSGTVEVTAGSQGTGIMFFNNGTTNSELSSTYIVCDESATSVVIAAKATTFITKVVVTTDTTIVKKDVTSIEIEQSTDNHCVGVALDLTAKITPSDATNKSVKWTSSDTTIGTIDEYTGRVTFVAAGEVTFTATACDGSGVTKSVTCNPIAASWSVAEFYINKDGIKGSNEIAGEESANFTYGDIYNGDIAPFKNLAGETITTNRAAKMNGSGYVKFATTKEAYVTIVMADRGKTVDAVLSVTGENGGTADLISQTGDSKYPTLVYKLSGGDSWTIKRDATVELNVIAYVKVEYDAVWDFKEANPSTITTTKIEGKTGTVVSNQEAVSLTVDATNGKLEYNASGYAQFNNGTIIKVPVVNVGSIITVVSYSGQSKYTIGAGDGMVPADTSTDKDVYTVTAADVEKGYVEIIATGGAYIYSISLSNPR